MNKSMLTLSRQFYDEKAVRMAIDDFSDVIAAEVIEKADDTHIQVMFKDATEPQEEIQDEFCNYVLGIMINERMV